MLTGCTRARRVVIGSFLPPTLVRVGQRWPSAVPRSWSPRGEPVRAQVAVLSKTMARPTGRVEDRLVAVSVLGDVRIDLAHAKIGSAGIVLVARACCARSISRFRPTQGEHDRAATDRQPEPTREPGPIDGPAVVIKALAGMVSVTIHRAETGSLRSAQEKQACSWAR